MPLHRTLMLFAAALVLALPLAIAQDDEPEEQPVPDAGRVEGTLMLGGEAVAGERVVLERNEPRLADGPAATPDATLRYATTDEAGRFVFENVAPGEIRVGYLHVFDVLNENYQELGATPSHRVAIRLEPNGSATVNVGGVGRRVTGKIVSGLPENIRLAPEGAVTRLLRVVLPPAPFPTDISDADRAQWLRDWLQTEEGKAYRRGYTSYVIDIDEDGRFYALDVPPGTYSVDIAVPEWGRQTAGPVARVLVDVTVPEASADKPEAAVDLGELVARPVRE